MPFSPYRRELHSGRRFKDEKYNIIVNAKVINVLLITKRFALNYAKYYRLKKLHTSLYMCKNKTAHITCSVQKLQ